MNDCPPEARVDGHDEHEVETVEGPVEPVDRRCGAQHEARLAPDVPDEGERAVEVIGPLGMDGDPRCPRASEVPDEPVNRTGHEVHVDGNVTGGARRGTLHTIGPKVRFGTKWLSITSKWMRSAPARTTASTSSPRCAKSAERRDGAIHAARAVCGDGSEAMPSSIQGGGRTRGVVPGGPGTASPAAPHPKPPRESGFNPSGARRGGAGALSPHSRLRGRAGLSPLKRGRGRGPSRTGGRPAGLW